MKTHLADQQPDFQRAQMIIERSRKNYGGKPRQTPEPRPAHTEPSSADAEDDAFKDFDPDDLFA